MSWDEVGVRHGTDKSSIGHDYLRHYERALGSHDIRSVLEIGVDTGASLRTWCDIFPDAEVWGIDIRPECADADVDRAEVLIGDATDPDWTRSQLVGLYDLIVDDGSHQLPDVLKSMVLLSSLLAEKGTYIVEDMPVGSSGSATGSLLSVLADLPDINNIWSARSLMGWCSVTGFTLR